MRRIFALLAIAFVLALVAVPAAASAAASQPQPQLLLGFQTSTTAGQPIALSAYLVDPAGNPIAGQTVHFALHATFLNAASDLDIGDPVTDSTGLALVQFTPRIDGKNVITATYDGGAVFASNQVTGALDVQPGPQLYDVQPPFRIPGADIWMVTGILGVVWGLYLIALFMGFRVARQRGAS